MRITTINSYGKRIKVGHNPHTGLVYAYTPGTPLNEGVATKGDVKTATKLAIWLSGFPQGEKNDRT